MRTSRLTVLALFGLLTGGVASLRAQDQRNVPEPPFPATCAVVHAPLRSSGERPIVGSTAAQQDAESEAETKLIRDGLHQCAAQQAVELALGHDSSYNAFLLDPVTLPQGVSLIIDGGVTVFASRDPRNYQDSTTTVQCGTYGPEPPYGVNVGCIPFLTLAANSGIYGYGVIDAQGGKQLIFYPPFDSTVTAPTEPFNWWALTSQKSGCVTAFPDKNCEQSSPLVISGGDSKEANSPNDNLTLYKITIRNPPFHTVSLGGTNVTVWGVKVQAPWNLPNTDGFDIHASNVTVYDTTVANGDQEIAFGSNGTTPSQNITVDHFHGYSKGGITILGSGDATSNLLVQNVDITGDLPSVVIGSVPGMSEVNGMSEKEMQKGYGIQSYGQALPNATNDLKALQITDSSQNNTSKPGSNISDVVFKSVCIQDIVKPFNVTFSASDQTPTVKGLVLQDIHVLAPTAQFPEMSKGIPDGNPGSYQLSFVTQPTAKPIQFTLDNVVFDDQAATASPTVSSISSIDAEVNEITTSTNVYPSVLNELTPGSPKQPGPPKLTLLSNTYVSKTAVSNPALAYACGTGQMPFTIGDLYVSLGDKTGDWTNLQSVSVKAGSSVTLNAVIQPIMSQTTNFISGSYGANPGLLAVGSPALRNPVIFYEGSRPIGFGILSANGTLATLVVKNISAGTHTYTAQYPADRFYTKLNFGSVTVQATPRRF
jgi:polygalacturonase